MGWFNPVKLVDIYFGEDFGFQDLDSKYLISKKKAYKSNLYPVSVTLEVL